jgi:hypothetical protein
MPVTIVKYMAVNGSEMSGAPLCLSSRRIFSVYTILKMPILLKRGRILGIIIRAKGIQINLERVT